MINSLLNFVGKRKAVVLNYHRVSDQVLAANYEHLSSRQFELHLEWLHQYFNVISLDELFKHLVQDTMPDKCACITIDDGYIDSYEVIFPLLKKYGLPATLFVSTEGLETGILWDEEIKQNILNLSEMKTNIEIDSCVYEVNTFRNKLETIAKFTQLVKYKSTSQRAFLLSELRRICTPNKYVNSFVNAAQLKEMSQNGMSIGAHSHSHPILNSEDLQFCREDIQKSKDILESLIQMPIDYFAYPNGRFGLDFTEEHVQLISELGFKAGLTTDKGIVNVKSDQYLISRFTPWDTTKFGFCSRLAKNFWEAT